VSVGFSPARIRTRPLVDFKIAETSAGRNVRSKQQPDGSLATTGMPGEYVDVFTAQNAFDQEVRWSKGSCKCGAGLQKLLFVLLKRAVLIASAV
jgi:hypothetical protein